MKTQPKFEKQFFPHDFNARGDQNIVALMAEHGMAGYGLYWVIVEKLYEADGFLDANYKLLSYDLRVDESRVKKIIEDSKLFSLKGGKFYSESVLRRLEIRRAKSSKASMAAHVKWEKEKSATAQDDFKAFWKAYPKQESPDAALAMWLEKKPPLDKCLKALAWQKKLPKWNEDNGRWIPAPAAYLKSGKWADIPNNAELNVCDTCGKEGIYRKGINGKRICRECKEAKCL
jgi:hypothetical protein